MATRFDIYTDTVTNDWIVKNLDLRITADKSEFVAQKITEVLLFILGEWFLDRDQGLPYFGELDDEGNRLRETGIMVKNPDLNYISTLYRDKINSIIEIIEIIEFNLSLNTVTRTLTIDFIVAIGENEEVTGTIII